LKPPEPQRSVGRDAAPGCRRDSFSLRVSRCGSREVADPRACYAKRGEVDRQLRKRAGVAD